MNPMNKYTVTADIAPERVHFEHRCSFCGFLLFQNILRDGNFIMDPFSLKTDLILTANHLHFCICPECHTKNQVNMRKEGRRVGLIEDFNCD